MNRTTCLDPTYAFRDFGTFSGCFYSWSNTTGDSPEASLATNTPFGGVIQGCLTNYCNFTNSALGGCDYGLNQDSLYRLTLTPNVNFDSWGCRGINGRTNTDIAGPGAIISYAIQLFIVGGIWLGMLLLDAITRKNTRDYVGQAHMSLIQKAADHRPVVRFVLVEFQEAQCFFMIAIQVASILAMSSNSKLYGAASLLQLGLNISMSRSVCLKGIVPITFGLWLVYKTNMKSWYTLLLSTATVILSIVTFYMSSHLAPMPLNLDLPHDNGGLYKCGLHPPPLVWCGYTVGRTRTDSWVVVVFAIGICLFGCLLCHALFVILRDRDSKWFRAVSDGMTGFFPLSEWMKSEWMRSNFTILSICVELGMVVITIMATLAPYGKIRLDQHDWNFGQFIAVTIWAPVVVKYVYWSLFGFESYSAQRIPLPYKITNTESDPSPSLDPGRTAPEYSFSVQQTRLSYYANTSRAREILAALVLRGWLRLHKSGVQSPDVVRLL